jgi:hypothetical protein
VSAGAAICASPASTREPAADAQARVHGIDRDPLPILGLAPPTALGANLVYTVPSDRRAQLIYLRAGNTAPELVYVELLRNGKVMRLFRVGAPWHVHVPLAVVEDLFAATRLEVRLGAPRDLRAGAELFAITMFGDEPYGNDAGHEGRPAEVDRRLLFPTHYRRGVSARTPAPGLLTTQAFDI